MPNKTLARIKVEKLTKYGFQVLGGEYVNWGAKLAESERGKVVPGGEYEFELFIADSGKKYVNAVVGQVKATSTTQPVATPAPAVTKKVVEPKSETMSKGEWQAKDRSQLIGGLSHDAAAVTAALVAVNGLADLGAALAAYEKVLTGMLQIRDGMK